MTWRNVVIPKIRKILPGLIAQDIVGVQPMVLPQDLAILSSAMVIYKRHATNSDGIRFRFDPMVGQDEINHFLDIKVSYFRESNFRSDHDVGEMILSVKGYSEKEVEEFIKICLKELREQIDDLTICESFNIKAALKILEEKQQQLECTRIKNQDDNTISPQ